MVERRETDLIIVPCHGVCQQGCTSTGLSHLDSSWIGNFPGEGTLYIEHVRAGVALAAANPASRLAFSGGQTRAAAPGRSEAESYREIAENAGWWSSTEVMDRTILEEYSRDSFDNLLFPIAQFKLETGRWPARVTVAGWGFKKDRFGLHRLALKWPEDRYGYVGVNDPAGEGLSFALAGEHAKFAAAHEDPYLKGTQWAVRRQFMNPFRRQHPFRVADPHLAAFFDFLDDSEDLLPFTGRLPWEEQPSS